MDSDSANEWAQSCFDEVNYKDPYPSPEFARFSVSGDGLNTLPSGRKQTAESENHCTEIIVRMSVFWAYTVRATAVLMLAGTEVLSLANQKDSELREREWQEAGVNTFKQQKYIILTICIRSIGIVEHFYCTFSGLLWKRKSI